MNDAQANRIIAEFNRTVSEERMKSGVKPDPSLNLGEGKTSKADPKPKSSKVRSLSV